MLLHTNNLQTQTNKQNNLQTYKTTHKHAERHKGRYSIGHQCVICSSINKEVTNSAKPLKCKQLNQWGLVLVFAFATSFVWLGVAVYGCVWLCVALFGCVWLCLALYGSCVPLHGCVPFSIITHDLYHSVRLCIILYAFVWLCITFHAWALLCFPQFVCTTPRVTSQWNGSVRTWLQESRLQSDCIKGELEGWKNWIL